MLEQLSTSTNEQDQDILNDVYIRWPVDLERSLMEGSYTKAWRAKSRAPRKEYEVLAEGLMGTIRCVRGRCVSLRFSRLTDFLALSFWKRCSHLSDVATILPGRNDIASCHEKAYQALPLAEASRLLFFDNESEAMKFGQQVGYIAFLLVMSLTMILIILQFRFLQRGWNFSPTSKIFTFPSQSQTGTTSVVDSTSGGHEDGESASDLLERRGLVRKALEYATELEAIV